MTGLHAHRSLTAPSQAHARLCPTLVNDACARRDDDARRGGASAPAHATRVTNVQALGPLLSLIPFAEISDGFVLRGLRSLVASGAAGSGVSPGSSIHP